MLRQIQGNIFLQDTICKAQVVNDKMKMGKGLALEFKRKYPTLMTGYVNYTSFAGSQCLGTCYIHFLEDGRCIANLFGQRGYGVKKPHLEIELFRNAIKDMKFKLRQMYSGVLTISVPYKIGCDLAGGNWDEVFEVLTEEFGTDDYFDVVICKYDTQAPLPFSL